MRKLLIVLSLLGSFLHSSIAHAQPQASFSLPASAYLHPQQLINVTPTRKINLYCIGQGSPTVLFDSGLGDGTLSWRLVQGPIGKLTRACSYDRANYFYSDPVSRRATAQAAVDDLLALVDQAKLGPQIILVGHSRGGLNARLFAFEHRERLAGLVLVDPTITEQLSPRTTKDYVHKYENYLRRGEQLRACRTAAQQGQLSSDAPDPLHCLGSFDRSEQPQEQQLASSVRTLETSAAFQATLYSERQYLFYPINDVGDSTDGLAISDARRPLGDLPMVVIAADWFKSSSFKGKPTIEEDTFLKWNLAQMQKVSSESTQGRLLVVPSQHYVQKERPDVVIRAIEDVLDRVRQAH